MALLGGRDRGSSYVLPVGPSILISLLDEFHTELAAAFDAHVAAHGVPGNSGAKPGAADSSTEAAWRAFPRSCAFYAPQIARLASVASCIKAEQMLTEVTLNWIPSAATGAAFSRSQFDFAHFQQRLKCVSQEQGQNPDAPRIIELVQMIVGVSVRAGRLPLHSQPGRGTRSGGEVERGARARPCEGGRGRSNAQRASAHALLLLLLLLPGAPPLTSPRVHNRCATCCMRCSHRATARRAPP